MSIIVLKLLLSNYIQKLRLPLSNFTKWRGGGASSAAT